MASWQLPYKVLNTSPCSYVHCAAVPDVAIQTTALKKTCPYKFLLSVNLLVLAGHQPLDRRKWPPVLKPTYRNIPNGCKQCSIIIARPLRMFRFFRQRDLETDYLQLWPEPLLYHAKSGGRRMHSYPRSPECERSCTMRSAHRSHLRENQDRLDSRGESVEWPVQHIQ